MTNRLAFILSALLFATAVFAQVPGGGGTIIGGSTPVTGTCSNGQFLYDNSGVVGCSASSATIALPQAVTGGTSGGIPYFSNTTTMSTSAALAANALVIGGGAGTAPSTTTTGTGVLTALGTNVGSAGAFIVNGGALGTPSSGTLTNATGLPISTGVSGLGTGVATAAGNAVNTNGGLLTASTAAIAANAIVTGAGSGTALTGTTPGTGVMTALGTTLATASDVQTGTSGAALVTPTAISGSAAPQTLTDGATISWNVQSGYNAKLTLTASGHTLANPTNVVLGYTYVVVISASTFTMSFDTAYDWGGAGAPTLTASKDNIVACYAKGTSGANSLYCVANLGF